MAAARIMVVEDERLIARHLVRSITNLGYDVVASCAEGRQALSLIPELRPDLVLMDIGLKDDVDGIEAATVVAEQFRIPVIFVTAFSDTQSRTRAQSAQPAGYLVKPFHRDELRRVLEDALKS